MFLELIIFLTTTIVSYYLFIYKRNHYIFDKNELKYVPGMPVFGNTFKSMCQKVHMVEDFDEVYKRFPDERYVGYCDGTTPAILVRDPEIIKDITIKDFDFFLNHKDLFPENENSVVGANLFNMKDDRWRDMRTTLSPAFTGSKMRLMMPLMVDISKNALEYLKEHQSEDILVDDLIRRYTIDVIASAAFGLQVNSFVDQENEFYKSGQSLFGFTWIQQLTMLFFFQFPNFSRKIGLKLFTDKITRFFQDIVAATMDYRLKNNVERPDMIQLLIEATKGTLHNGNESKEKDIGFATAEETLKPKGVTRNWTKDELASQVFIFFAAGFETSASAITLTVHELALNPDVQEKLYEEVKAFNDTKGKLLYENVGELKYLDCILNETSRRWAAALFLDRICTKPYELPPPREGAKPVKVKPGTLVYMAVNSIHMDPKYYPEPQKYCPDRFSDEKKKLIQPCTFMPFGSGPRICIGSRFAMLELKVLIYYLVLNFKILKCEKTMNPIKLQTKDFNIRVAGGSWARFEARS
ncbi:probable cytochrome P450 9f2 [Manduca sexta]|uniref:unspecific monooxygenase n=1 Tax=Manduca sexta TaxID=7130 RepID=A0A922CWJ4_MANSE|nr:probable cytochrome P450 9f2 [Manduca sexta]KAG6460653.1 hypothetical protein O3G_MSEX012131 [Manduca sexta]KAG6460654.1 hypothetical protein O3G_MSEX012131 [Manduca sexta]